MKQSHKQTISVITLGCSKNLVDSEVLMRQLDANSFALSDDPGRADVVIINTCGFIDAAKAESVNTILEAGEMKKAGKIKKLFVAGCLSERYKDDLERELDGVDAFFGVTDFKNILKSLGGEYKRELIGERHLTTPRHFAYMKISEGCDRPCSFCAIPLMRGRHVSKPMPDVLTEATDLAAQGVKELILIAQDTTSYGIDINGRRSLAPLLRSLTQIDGIEWIRLMYAYPSQFPMDVLNVLRDEEKLCRYIDIPIQHCSDTVLRSMRRGITQRKMRDLLNTMRDVVPGITLRTTLIVGYPNEGEREFEEMYNFVEEMKFDRLGVFTYSLEEQTTAEPLGDPVPPEIKEQRKAAIMELQSRISFEKNSTFIGSMQRVLLDGTEGDFVTARTQRDAPEIDNEVLIPKNAFQKKPQFGTFATVRITEADEFDLFGNLSPAPFHKKEMGIVSRER